VSHTKTAKPIEMPFGMQTGLGPYHLVGLYGIFTYRHYLASTVDRLKKAAMWAVATIRLYCSNFTVYVEQQRNPTHMEFCRPNIKLISSGYNICDNFLAHTEVLFDINVSFFTFLKKILKVFKGF